MIASILADINTKGNTDRFGQNNESTAIFGNLEVWENVQREDKRKVPFPFPQSKG